MILLGCEQSAIPGPPFPVHPEEVQALPGESHRLEVPGAFDVLDESPRSRARGHERLIERVYRLDPLGA